MTQAEAGTLTNDDALYDALYDVRREAEEMGNYIEGDPYPVMNALREQGAVQKGFMRQLMHLPAFHRHKGSLDREGYTCSTFEACEQAFRDNVNLSNNVYHFDRIPPKTMGILEMDNPEHHAFRKAVQSLFIRPRAQKWWRENFIDAIVDDLVTNLHGRSGPNSTSSCAPACRCTRSPAASACMVTMRWSSARRWFALLPVSKARKSAWTAT